METAACRLYPSDTAHRAGRANSRPPSNTTRRDRWPERREHRTAQLKKGTAAAISITPKLLLQ
jgi:hypothetical protein